MATATDAVTLVLLGEPRDGLDLEPLEPAVSAVTGRPMRRFRVIIRIHECDHERLGVELSDAGATTPLADTDGRRWKVSSNSYSYQAGTASALVTHIVELEEQEDLELQRIEFEEIILIPRRWSIDSRTTGPTVLTVLADLEAEGHLKLEAVLKARDTSALPTPYIPVNLVGITDAPRSMRFGRCLWQALGEGSVRHLLRLVSEDGDEAASFVGFNEPEISRLLEQSMRTSAKVDALIAELQRAAALDGEAVERIRNATAGSSFEAAREFSRAEDVETFFL